MFRLSLSFRAATTLFFLTAGLSAFLLFLVQPMVGKSLLPVYGGGASVWTACLLFFQTVLLAGYGYAHLLRVRVPSRFQPWIHGAVLALALAMSHILPRTDPASTSPSVVIFALLLTLLRHVGIPFFALSATAPLLQHWFFRRFASRSPYTLYAISNAGSFAAVLAYPFVVEPLFALPAQASLWRWGFVLFVAGCLFCAWPVGRGVDGAREIRTRLRPASTNATRGAAQKGERLLWVGFSAMGSMLLLTTTEQISQDVAATPLLWMVPLCLYLLSYVICFSRDSAYRRGLWLSLVSVAPVPVGVLLFYGGELPIALQLLMYAVTLFAGCMTAHGELAKARPDAERLTSFYLWSSLGGIAGGAMVAIVAPLVFPDLWEYSLLWPFLLVLAWAALSREAITVERELKQRRLKWVLAAGILLGGSGFIVNVVHDHVSTVFSSRNFYGRLTISETRSARCLYHGRTLHGCQPKKMEALTPSFYYSPGSGVGVAQRIYRELHPGPVHTGVVGLGVGICALWNQPGDEMRFYELDSDVIELARNEFQYVEQARGRVEIVPGDARLTLADEVKSHDASLDILVMDAFSSDAIPMHLLTREAIDLYRRRIHSKGVLAFHISNRNVNLEPLILGAARRMGGEAFLISTETDYADYILDSTWVVISSDAQFIERIRASDSVDPWPEKFARPVVFTDQYSNILELLF